MNQDWTHKEVNLIVQDYFKMLQAELLGNEYNKTVHRLALQPNLNSRSEGSIEFKHQNISAALIKMGLPYIAGYKPRFNYQKELLEREISAYILNNQIKLEKEFEKFSNEIGKNKQIDENVFNGIIDSEPVLSQYQDVDPLFRPIKVNYLEREQNNRVLGEAGEKLVLEYEKWSLINLGKENLADKIEWVSKVKGDGLGFDILSRNIDGTDKYIEVKTTKLSKDAPIYLSRTEVHFASLNEKNFYLYRVFNFNKSPRIFIKEGNYESFCRLTPQSFKGFFT